ncbi:hypothetical protein [Rosistilla oblonga]|uniref:hypothetical protein n=1 Tax=Rosistilla oblonga TaxID=2527990 RepID=UPI0011A910F6|nr:hypothetical protein [Rosistilla oblonga]
MGEDDLGWYVGGVPSFARMIDNMRRINESAVGGRWIVVPATRAWASVAYEQWFDEACSGTRSTLWQDDAVTFCVPERLAELGKGVDAQHAPIAGVILLDPNCIVHRGRGFGKRKSRIAHDRPQLIVNFRSKLAVGNWCPPLMVMSLHKAAAVSTQDISRVYGLDAMHFIDGATLSCGGIKKPTKQNPAKAGQITSPLVSH